MKRLITILLLCFLVACSTTTGAKPSDVSQDIWDNGINFTLLIDLAAKEKTLYPPGYAVSLASFTNPPDKSSKSQNEQDILNTIQSLSENGYLSIKQNTDPSEQYKKDYAKLEDIFGKDNLKPENLPVEFTAKVLAGEFGLSGSVVTSANNLVAETNQLIEDYMKENSVSLKAKDVQFNMKNNLDREFVIAGTAKLSDYYNYGFDSSIESTHFAIEVTPFDGNFSDRWHLYLQRSDFNNLFEKLKNNGEEPILAVSEIPSYLYKDGQGNMAEVVKARWAK